MVFTLKEIKVEGNKLPASLGNLSPALQAHLRTDQQSHVDLLPWKRKLKLPSLPPCLKGWAVGT